ncbi:hypothetical protein ACFQ2B_30065 [Streptomyces stramineus]
MRRPTPGRLSLSAILAFVVALLGLAAQPASAADTPPMTIAVDKASATPGSTVTIKLTFTNDQSTNAQFVYQSIQPTWNTSSDPGLKYAFSECTGDTTSCTVAAKQSGAVSYSVPVLPGASRTVTLTYQVAADSACGPSRGSSSTPTSTTSTRAGRPRRTGCTRWAAPTSRARPRHRPAPGAERAQPRSRPIPPGEAGFPRTSQGSHKKIVG